MVRLQKQKPHKEGCPFHSQKIEIAEEEGYMDRKVLLIREEEEIQKELATTVIMVDKEVLNSRLQDVKSLLESLK